MNSNTEPEYQIEETNYYFDKETQNHIVVLKAKYRDDEKSIYISGSIYGCSITTEEIIASKFDAAFYEKHKLLELDYQTDRKEASGKYYNLVLEHIGHVAERNFSRWGKTLLNIYWIPPQFTVFILEKDWEQFKTGYDYLVLNEDGYFTFLTAEQVFKK